MYFITLEINFTALLTQLLLLRSDWHMTEERKSEIMATFGAEDTFRSHQMDASNLAVGGE